MAFSNSFHSSAKTHSIGSAASLAKAEKHNERGYYSRYYSADKISTVIGGPGLAASVEDFISKTFDPLIEEHNAKQKRKDRCIEGGAFEHFCNNKKLDIAVESIFQIGDMEFWSRWRQETIIKGKAKEIVLKDFPPVVKAVMDEIYRRQMETFEQIYETDGAEILAKIELQYTRSKAVLDDFEPELAARFTKIAEMKKSDDRAAAVRALPPEEQECFGDFFSAYHSVKDIVRKKLRERIAGGQMHIKLINGTAHYDEWSPHAHGISVCWADGFQNGLPSRVAKAIVLNRYTLEVLQDKMHEIAQEEIAKHPEIFGAEQLKEKSEGRNMDWTTEQLVRHKQAQLLQDTESLEFKRSRLTGELGMMEIQKADMADSIQAAGATAADLQQQNTALASQLAAGWEELEKICQIKTMAERDQVASEAMGQIDELRSAFDVVDDFCAAAENDMEYGSFNLRNLVQDFIFEWRRLRERIANLVDSIKEKIRNIGIFEHTRKLRPEEQVAPVIQESLDKTLAGAASRADTGSQQIDIEQDLPGGFK